MSAPAPELLSAAQAGDRAAEERLIVENSRLIWSIVRRYTGRGAEQEDLYQLGCIGFSSLPMLCPRSRGKCAAF